MKILKYLIPFLIIYLTTNVVYWFYQEYTSYDDVQNIKSLGNTINITRVNIEEKDRSLEIQKKFLDEERLKLDNLLADKKYNQYNELILDYNKEINEFNLSLKEYENLVNMHNQNVKIINDLIIKSGTRKYLFPIQSYTPELYREL